MKRWLFLLICLVFAFRDGIAQPPGRGQRLNDLRPLTLAYAIEITDGSMLALWPNEPLVQLASLNNESIRRALQINSDQATAIKAASKDNYDQIQNAIRKKSADRPQEVIVREFSAKAANTLEEILLPSQLIRLRQFAFHVEISQRGLSEAFAEGELAKAIGVNGNQKYSLFDKGKAIEQKIAEKIQQARNEAIKELLHELTPEQRAHATELLGESFTYELPTSAKILLDGRKKIKQRNTRREAAMSGSRDAGALASASNVIRSTQ